MQKLTTKKQREKQIFEMVYGDRSFNDIKHNDNECPDFIVQALPATSYFGVEITEFYHSETSARLDRISEYTLQLLDGADFKHKNDRKTLKVIELDILREDNSIHEKNVPAVIQEVPSLSVCAQQVAQRIGSKAALLRNATAKMSHVNLIIHDKTRLLRPIRTEDFYCIFFVPEMVSVLAGTPFREVFFVTEIEDKHVYVRLKMFYLLAAAFLFNGVLSSQGFAKQLPPEVDDVELFASYFASTVKTPVLIHRDIDGIEVICHHRRHPDPPLAVKLTPYTGF